MNQFNYDTGMGRNNLKEYTEDYSYKVDEKPKRKITKLPALKTIKPPS